MKRSLQFIYFFPFIQYGPPETKTCVAPVLRKIFNGLMAMAMSIYGNKKLSPKAIAEPPFVHHTTLVQKTMGSFLLMGTIKTTIAKGCV